MYKRFIDDIFLMVLKGFNIELLVGAFDYLKLNIITSKKVVFLDLVINLDQVTGQLVFSLYTKPTCTFSYLLNVTNHPDFIFKNLPLSLFIRIRRICLSYSDFLYFGSRLIGQLADRGYNRLLVFKTFSTVSKIDRNLLIPYKSKNLKENKNTVFFKFPFDVNLRQSALETAFNTSTNELLSSKFFRDKKFKIVYRMQ